MIERIALLFALAASCSYATAADTNRRAGVVFNEPTALDDAVAQFNAQVNRVSEIGRTQPPLTADEIVAAIRAWSSSQSPVQPELYAVFERIAETKTLPPGSEIDFTTGWNPGHGYRYTVWWVNLNVSAPSIGQEGSRVGYAYRVRDRKLSSQRSEDPIVRPSGLTDAKRQRYIAESISKISTESDNWSARHHFAHAEDGIGRSRMENQLAVPGDGQRYSTVIAKPLILRIASGSSRGLYVAPICN